MSVLAVPGAHLYYETRGEGPLMLLIPGGSGDARVFAALAEQLSPHYTVATYDRRGFSRSLLDGAQDYAHRLATDADDARRLIEHLTDAPGTVLGASSGGVVALQLLTDHPDAVTTLIPYEPAAMRLLPDASHWLGFFDEVYDLYRRCGPAPARATFREHTFPGADDAPMDRATDPAHGPQVIANATYWCERELRQYSAAPLDHDQLIRHAQRVIPAVGRASRGYPTYTAGVELAKLLSRPVLQLPGGHVGYATEPAAFAVELLTALRGNNAPTPDDL